MSRPLACWLKVLGQDFAWTRHIASACEAHHRGRWVTSVLCTEHSMGQLALNSWPICFIMFYHIFWMPWGWVPDVPSKVAHFLKENSLFPCWSHLVSMLPELDELPAPATLHYHSTTTSACSPPAHSPLCLRSCQAGARPLSALPHWLADPLRVHPFVWVGIFIHYEVYSANAISNPVLC